MDTLAFYKVDEGEGTTLNDSSGNENHATLSTGDAPSFWSGAPMVSQEIMDAEAVQGSNYFTDGEGHALPMTQQDWGELGEDIVSNGYFKEWTDSTVPDDWLKIGTHDANNYVEENANGMRLVSNGTYVGITTPVTIGKTYEIKVSIHSFSVGGTNINDAISVQDGSFSTIANPEMYYPGLHTFNYTAQADVLRIKRANQAVDGVVEWVSVREVNPVMNQNKQYYLTNCNGLPNLLIYNRVLTTAEDAEVKAFGCL